MGNKMTQLSKNFTRTEFSCNCGCGYDTVDAELLEVLQDIREHFAHPVKINSACRCWKHNEKINGSKNSRHLFARAADIRVEFVPPKTIQQYLKEKYPNKYGIGSYPTFTHIDTRENQARW